MESVQIESAVVNSSDEALDMWAFVEVMGHSKIAGRIPYIEAQRQLPAPTDPTRSDDFFDFCVSNGLPDDPEEMSHEELKDALKLYASRNERRSDDAEDDDRALF